MFVAMYITSCGLLASLQELLVRMTIFVGIILRIIGGFKRISRKNNREN